MAEGGQQAAILGLEGMPRSPGDLQLPLRFGFYYSCDMLCIVMGVCMLIVLWVQHSSPVPS